MIQLQDHDLQSFKSAKMPARSLESAMAEIDMLLSEATRKISRKEISPREIREHIEMFFQQIGSGEQELSGMSALQIQQLFIPQVATRIGEAFGLLGKSAMRCGEHLRGLHELEKGMELCPHHKKLLFAISNSCHSVQWDYLKAVMEDSLGRVPSFGEVRLERIREHVLGVRATQNLLAAIGVGKHEFSLKSCEFKRDGMWAFNNMAHYYLMLGNLKQELDPGLYNNFQELADLSVPKCYELAIQYAGAVLHHFGVPPNIDDYASYFPTLAHDKRMVDSTPQTVSASFCVQAAAFDGLGRKREAMICASLAVELAPDELIPKKVLERVRNRFALNQRVTQGVVGSGKSRVIGPKSWSEIEASLKPTGDVQESFINFVQRGFRSYENGAELFVQHFRSEPLIENAWEIAAEPAGLERVRNILLILKSLSLNPKVSEQGLGQAVGRYEEIVNTMGG